MKFGIGIGMMVWAAVLIVAMVCLACAVNAWTRARKSERRQAMLTMGFFVQELREILTLPSKLWERGARVKLANIAEGTHPHGQLNKLADAAITTRFLLYKIGSDIDHIAVAGATDLAIGTVADEVATADLADTYVTLNLLGKGGTKRMVANAAITAGARVYQAAAGKVSSTGTRCVGVALMAAAADLDVIEVDDAIHLTSVAGYQLMFMGTYTWAAGAASSAAATVTGVLSTDIVIATPLAVAGAGLLQKAVPTTDTITFTTNANFANADKISYAVYRAA